MKRINKTQRKIVAAAKLEYAVNGYSATSFQAIAERSKASKSLINYYFPKKQDILVSAFGIHLSEIHEYVSGLHKYDSLMRLFLERVIYYVSYMQDPVWLAFNKDIQDRFERDLSAYKSCFFLFEEVAAEFRLPFMRDELFRISISAFGVAKQLVASYLAGEFPDIPLREVMEQMLLDTASLMQLNNYTVQGYISHLWSEFDSLPRKFFPFFREPEFDVQQPGDADDDFYEDGVEESVSRFQ